MAKVQATISFRAGRVFVPAGSWRDQDDPVVKNWPTLFTAATDAPVRTTATLPKEPTAPPPTMTPDKPVRPAATASVALWRSYVAEVDPGAPVDDMTKAELKAFVAGLGD